MKKLLTLTLAALLALCLFACGEPTPPPELGSMTICFDTEADRASYPNVIEVESEGPVSIALTTDGKSAQGVMVEAGQMNEDATEFVPDAAIYGNDLMGPEDLVLLRVPYFETLPNLRLTYTGAGGTVHFYITQSGKDGSLQLISAD